MILAFRRVIGYECVLVVILCVRACVRVYAGCFNRKTSKTVTATARSLLKTCRLSHTWGTSYWSK